MPSTPSATPTPITPPRVPLIDSRTGLIDRAWYMFFLSLFTTANNASDAALGPDAPSLLASFDAELRSLADAVGTQFDAQSAAMSLAAALAALEQQTAVQPSNELGELQQQIDTLAQAVALQPAALPLNSGAFFNIVGPATAGSVAYGNGTSITFSAAGSSGQLLTSGGSGAPTWTSLSSIGVTSINFGTTGLTPATATSGAITVAGTLAIANGGTGGTTTPTNGQLLIGNGTGYTVANLTAGSGVSISNSAGGISISATGTGGTVTSVGLSMPTQFAVTNSPVTSSGTLTAAWNNQTANYVLAGPTTGAAAAPTFRALVSSDIPALSYVSSVAGTSPISSSGGLTPTISISQANSTTSGYLSSTDWNTFNNKQPAGSYLTAVSVASANGFAGSSSGGTTPALTISTSITGLLYGNGTALAATTVSAPLTYSAGTLAITQATTSTNGYLSSTDWNTFNNKQPAGTYVTSVTGTSPVASSGGTTPAISLASGYGDTQNPYASKTANYVLAAPNGSAGVPTFRALVAADIPSLPYNPTGAPATYTANFSVATTDVWVINNKSGSSCTATLPTASSYSGRVLYFQNYQAQTLVSASSNVVPIGGGAAATSILLASAGDQCTLVSNGTNWVVMQYVPNNSLLLE